MSKFCTNCGYQLPDNAKFCLECGAKLGDFSNDAFLNLNDNVIQRSQVGAAKTGNIIVSPVISNKIISSESVNTQVDALARYIRRLAAEEGMTTSQIIEFLHDKKGYSFSEIDDGLQAAFPGDRHF